MPARRPATVRTQSLRPLFSWVTRTAPLGVGASAQLPLSSPRGPGQVISVVGNAVAIPGAGPAAAVEVAGAVVALVLPEALVDVGAAARSLLQAAINAVADAADTPSSASRRIVSRRDNSPST